MILKISQNFQENTYATVDFLIKLQASACNFVKKETFFHRTPLMSVSVTGIDWKVKKISRETWRLITILSKELLFANLHVYRLDIPSLKLLRSYLTKQKQRLKLTGTNNSSPEILSEVLQGSIT